MKGLMVSGLTVLLLTTATRAMSEPLTKVQQAASTDSSMIFNFSAPIITNSGVRGSTHFFRVAVINMSLQDLMVSIPSQMDHFEGVRIVDQSGKDVAATTKLTKDRLAISFTNPVAPGGYLEVQFTGVQMNTSGGNILLYGVTAQRVGLSGQIPIGTARVQLPDRG